MEKLWFSIYDFSFDYKGDDPAFIEPVDFNWSREFEKNSEKIYAELKQYLETNKLSSYFNTSMVSKKESWKTIALKTWNIELFKNQKQFPFTTSLINKYPQIISTSFNLLEPKSKILPHCGDTNAIYRCHLGLDIPAGLPDCGLKVNNEQRAWQQGKWLVFTDAYTHEAWNNTDNERYIFLIDVLREGFAPKKNRVISTVLTSLFLQKRSEKLKFMRKQSAFTIKVITEFFRPFALLSVYVCNLFKVY